jgi:DNA replication and repair protein RecF
VLKKIWLKGFRNLDEGVFEFAEKGNVFLWGANNQGKTNFLEALFFLGNGGSPREDNLKNLVGFSAETLFLGGDFADVEGVSRVYFKVSSMGKREGSFNEKRLTRISALRERFPIAFISADAIRIFQESGSFRRRDLDRFCAGFIDGYGANIKRLERIIRQKNQLLKSNPSDEAIRLWNNQLVSVAATVVSGRKLALEKLGLVMESLL